MRGHHSPANDLEYEATVAIIGLAGRFPGARDAGAFWENIAGGVESIRDLTDDELDAAGVSAELLRDPAYVKRGAFLDGIDLFDAEFFGYPPREAEMMDPQHRLFLETAWHALEDAAYAPEQYAGLIGVFAGSAPSTYLSAASGTDPRDAASMSRVYTSMHNAADSLSSTVSYKLNLRGPSIAVQSFCSTSLVAVHLACQSLLTHECSLALAGGAVVTVPHRVGYAYQEGGIVSPDGHCRPFDRRAQGSVMGSGVGAVVLKRLEEATADGDRIYAIIRGSAINNDGVHKVGYTAPGVSGQASVVATALRRASVEAETITYLEAHGTGTALGDAVEVDALRRAFRRTTQRRFCAIGSVKANIGHLDRAAGIAGLIKMALALDRALLPPQVDFEAPGDDVDLDSSPFYVNTRLRTWPAESGPRRAGVSSFGAGGTNAHVVLEQAPELPASVPGRSHQLLLLSARTRPALAMASANLAAHLRLNPDLDLADVAWTLAVGRSVFDYRRAVVCRDAAEAATLLESADPRHVMNAEQVHQKRQVVFRVAAAGDTAAVSPALYDAESDYRTAVDRCRAMWAGDRPGSELLAAQYGLATLLVSWGVQAVAVIGSEPGGRLPDLLASASRLLTSTPDLPRFSAGEAALDQLLDDGRTLVLDLGLSTESRADAREAGAGGVGAGGVGAGGADGRTQRRLGTGRVTDHRDVLTIVARLWLAGVSIDWTRFYAPGRRRRLSLPPYPFERQRYWSADASHPASPSACSPADPLSGRSISAPSNRQQTERTPDIADWFYLPSWRRSAPAPTATIDPHTWLLFADDRLAPRLTDWLASRDQTVTTVVPADAYAMLGASQFTVRPGAKDDYIRMLRQLSDHDTVPERIVHLWLVGDPGTNTSTDHAALDASANWTAERGFYSLLALGRALAETGRSAVQLTLVSTGVQDVDADDRIDPYKALALGPCKVLQQETAGLACRSIDVALAADHLDDQRLVEQLGRELLAEPADAVLALRGDHRWVQAFEPVRVAADAPVQRLRRGGVYLITGGLGGIGLALADDLADRFQAKLALVGRSGLPPRHEWPGVLAEATERDVARRIRAIQSLESRGADVLVVQADVADPVQMRQAVQQTVRRFGTLNGVLHAAGVPGEGIIALKSREAAAGALAPKVQGTVSVARALDGLAVDFLVLFSSITSVVGGPGQADYCAANSFLEAFARQHRRDYGHIVAISWCEWLWDAWQAGLLGFPEEVRAALTAHRQRFGISFAEGADVLRRVLAADAPHLYVATFPLGHLVADSRESALARMVDEMQRGDQGRVRHPRPVLASSFIRPRGDLEERIATIWSDVLGVAPIGIDDNFFELGGNSLLGLELVERIRRSLKRNVGVQLVYAASTVRTIAEHLEAAPATAARDLASRWKARSEQRRESLRQVRSVRR